MEPRTQRPVSDRHPRSVGPPAPYEVRLAEPASDRGAGWRSVAFTVTRDDAARVAAALVSAAGDDGVFAELWGPDDDGGSHPHVLARFPEPDSDEQRQMWLDAADQHFGEGYSDLRR